ncbi:signal transduction histidine kinase/CheY-like chemotaxis protein/CHASE3 domain sensor protein [Spirosoma sp. LMG 31448]|uniref:histidine kinase n=2 Tax=Spirosoma utsteinense TaxID=2585773 RepID=A0ABR6W3Y1_9BACT|nr:signal transduction histidine kinase/CheY-like chemotaxis protein/CHASE3 domain sensor protein [Spirosoma utsteinense]MBC3791294.1 signal transduction histidine kinase/CheY-like chemotaxis protein/CHASE3 domain sensor protein [Spirosoma utsteinense]
MESGRRGFRSTGNRRFLQPFQTASRVVGPTIDELKILVSDNPPQLKRAYSIESNTATLLNFWRSLDKQGMTINRNSQTDITNVTTQEKEYTDFIHTQLTQLMKVEETLLAKRQKADTQAIEQSTYELLLGTLLTLLIVSWLIYLTVREFRGNRKAEELLQENFRELEQLNLAGTEKNWLLTGISAVNDRLQDITDASSLTQSILQTLSNYLNIPASAFYCFNEDKQELQMNASIALPDQVKRSYQLGESLIGQAALGRSMTITNHVPAHYWVIQAGSGQATPGQIVCMPLWYNQQLKGVLELSSFKPLDEQALRLLKAIANNIAVAINAADGHAKVMHLLQTVQEQKEELSNQQEELQQSNEELLRQAEILQASEEELKVQEEELREINAELKERNRTIEVARQDILVKAKELETNSKYKSEFLANMSHELRTPLNSVLILARLLADNKSSNLTDKQTEYANIIHRSGTDLLDLINDILDLSKIEAGKIDLFIEPVPVSSVARDIGQLFTVVAEEKGVQLVTVVGDGVPASFQTDRQRIGQVIKNLLSNAFKFTPKGGSVTLSFHLEERPGKQSATTQPTIAIAVTDTGIGIAPEKQQLIFEAFQQADGSTSRKFGGTGLGLSISKELIRKLGGELGLQSEPGKGSTFTIYLPVDMSEEITLLPASTSSSHLQPVVAPPASVDVPKPQPVADDRHAIEPGDMVILIVEDDPNFASIVRDFAREKNYKTIVALQGDEGLQCARQYKPSAIILDIGLPIVNGWDLLKMLQSDDALKHIPVHIISAMDESPSLPDNVLAYATKPIQQKDLEGILGIISKQLNEGGKKVLLLSGSHLTRGSIDPLLNERQFDLLCDYADSADSASKLLSQQVYNCIIADIGDNVEQGIQDLQAIQAAVSPRQIPIIIYLDKDLTADHERQLNKISQILIRDSFLAKNRLMDELELFFYKVQSVKQRPQPQPQPYSDTNSIDTTLTGRKVLLVDDDMRNVFALSTLLESQQMTVVTAGDGQEALDLLQQHTDIDLVLMDVMMPNMDGYEATRHIRKNQRYLDLPVIALTAKAMAGDREKCIEAGASDYITKPVDNGQLVSLMRVWLTH